MRFTRLLFLLFTLVSVSADGGNGFTIKTVVIDAGHGGKDPGASGPGKTNEKDVALAVALKLGEEIRKNYPDVNVIYTRKTDVFIELHERAEIANKNKADLFIAVHCNSSPSPAVYGTSTYVLGLHRTEANLEVAKRENSVILLEDDRDKNYEFDPNTPEGHIIMSMKQNAFLDQSIDIASKIEAQYETSAKRKSLGVKQAGFYVIYKTAMPSLLSEIGFISNPSEEKFLDSEKGQGQIAASLFKAFKDYKFEMENSEGEQYAYQEAKRKAQAADSSNKAKKQAPDQRTQQTSATEVKEPKPVTEKPVTEKSEVSPVPANQAEPDIITVTLLSGRKIKKPIDNASGGGISPEAPKPVETAPVKSETKPEAATTDNSSKPKPEPVVKSEPKPVITAATTEKPAKETKATETPKAETRKVTAGHSGGAIISTETAEKPEPKPVVETKSVKHEPKPVEKTPVAPKVEDKPAATVKAEKKTAAAETGTKPAVKPVAEDNAVNGVMTFKVQMVALKGPMKASEVTKVTKALGEITNEPIPSGLIRYYSGNSKSYAEAKRKVTIAVEAGYKDAFIVGFKNGTRFGPEKLKSYENQ